MAEYGSLYTLIGLFIGITIIVNIYLFSSRTPYLSSGLKYRLLPPSYIIATVWTILIGLMAYSEWLVYTKLRGGKGDKGGKDNWKIYLIPVLFIYCVLYPFYTMGFRNKKIVDFANVLTIILSGFIAWSIYDITQIGSYMILLTTLWSAYATFATLSTFSSV